MVAREVQRCWGDRQPGNNISFLMKLMNQHSISSAHTYEHLRQAILHFSRVNLSHGELVKTASPFIRNCFWNC